MTEQTTDHRLNPSNTVDTRFDEQISDLVESIRQSNSQIEELAARVQFAKAQLKMLLEQRGENWSDDDGYARLVSEGVRHSYDTKALDEMIITDPLRYGWLKDYRRESILPRSVHVR